MRMPDHELGRPPSSRVERADRCDTATPERISIAPLCLREREVVVADGGSRGDGAAVLRFDRPARDACVALHEVFGAAPGFKRANEAWQQGLIARLLRVRPGDERPPTNPSINPKRAKSSEFEKQPWCHACLQTRLRNAAWFQSYLCPLDYGTRMI